jgi:phosphatidylinositol glycan class B
MWPSYLIFFGALLRGPGVEDILCAEGYEGVGQGGSRIEDDGRRGGGVRDWRWDGLDIMRELHRCSSISLSLRR